MTTNKFYNQHGKRTCDVYKRQVTALGRLVPKISGPKTVKTKMLEGIVAPAVPTRKIVTGIKKYNILYTQRKMLSRVTRASRIVFSEALVVISETPLI